MNFNKTVETLKFMLLTSSIFSKNTYLVGGCVRDIILGIEPKDIDLCIDVPNGVEKFSKWLKENFRDSVSNFCEFPRFGTMNFTLHLDTGEKTVIDCVIPRTETYKSGSRKPNQINQTSLEDDAKRRDFCCNALYKRITDGILLDPTNLGFDDCKNKILRTPLDPKNTFIDDPLRMLRAIRFSCTKGFSIEENTKLHIYPYSNSYEKLSKERIRDEFEKILMSPKAIEGIKLLHDHGLLKDIIPELVEAWTFDQCNKHHSLSLRDHLFSVLEFVTKSEEDCLELRWAALLHDISKYSNFTWDGINKHFKQHEIFSSLTAEKILVRLRYSNEIISDVSVLIKNHMRFKQQYDYKTKKYTGTSKSLRKFISQLGPLVNKQLALIDADNLSHAPEYNMQGQVDDIRDKISEIMNNTSGITEINTVITGDDIMEFLLIGPGITVKEVKLVLQDYLNDNPKLNKDELFKLYFEEFGGKEFEVVPVEYNTTILKAVLGCANFEFNSFRYFGKDNIPKSKKSLPAIHYPILYRRLNRDIKVISLIDTINKSIVEIEKLEGFKSLQLNLENHDLCVDVNWDDNTTTTLL